MSVDQNGFRAMMRKNRYLQLPFLVVLAAFAVIANAKPLQDAIRNWDEDQLKRHSYKPEVRNDQNEYFVYLPNGYEESDRDWPTILYLHGYGQSGTNLRALLREGVLKEALRRENFPFIVVAPQAIANGSYRTIWERKEKDVLKVLDQAQSKYRIDSSRIYLTGISMGGVGSFYFMNEHADKFAAVVPIAGWGKQEWADGYGEVPFWVFHGLKDDAVAAMGSMKMVKAMRERGGDVRFTTYPHLGHDSWTPTYANDEVYEWLLQHRKDS